MPNEMFNTPFNWKPPREERIKAIVEMRPNEAWIVITNVYVYEAHLGAEDVCVFQMLSPLHWAYTA